MKNKHKTLTSILTTITALALSPLFAQEMAPAGATAEAAERLMRETRERMQQIPSQPDAERKPWRIGLIVEPVDATLRNHLDLSENTGVIVTQCQDGSPAARAGIKKNDIIVAVNGRPVGSIEPLRDSVMESAKTGKELRLSTLQKGQRRDVVIKPDMPKPPVERPRIVNPAPMQNPAAEAMMREHQQMVRRMAEQTKELMMRMEKQQNEVNRLRQQVEELTKGMREMKRDAKEEKKD
jgi:predicted metalloprotease with PDZ domain